jgi:hypothetical protein
MEVLSALRQVRAQEGLSRLLPGPRLGLVLATVLCWLALLGPAALPAAPGDTLKGQLVLVTKGSFKELPDKLVDEISDHIRARVQAVSITNVLKSADGRVILEINFPSDRKLAFEKMVAELPTVNFLVPLTVEGWNVKPSVEPASPEQAEESPSRRGDFDMTISARRDTISSLNFRDVALREILGFLGQQMSLEYVCPAEVGRRQITAQLRNITLAGFLESLRLSLDISIKKVGNVYVFCSRGEPAKKAAPVKGAEGGR